MIHDTYTHTYIQRVKIVFFPCNTPRHNIYIYKYIYNRYYIIRTHARTHTYRFFTVHTSILLQLCYCCCSAHFFLLFVHTRKQFDLVGKHTLFIIKILLAYCHENNGKMPATHFLSAHNSCA